MSLAVEYFTDQTHITDLQKLKDEELYFIIGLFRDELENFNESEEFKLKGLIIACNKMKDLIKDFRFILNGYIEVIYKNNLPLESLRNIEGLLSAIDIKKLLIEMDNIEINLDKIKKVRLLKSKVNELTDMTLYEMQILYDSLSDFIFGETHLWEDYTSRPSKSEYSTDDYSSLDNFLI